MENLNSDNLTKILSKNLVHYRQLSGLTQAELANKINYSDKSISKWERGDGLPDVSVLVLLSNIYGISMNDFFIDLKTTNVLPKKHHRNKRLYISILSGTLVWFIAALSFAILFIIPATHNYAWFSFIYAIPICGIILTVFSSMWGNSWTRIISTSIILWGLLTSLCLSLNIIKYIWILFSAGGFFEILIILWFIFYDKFKSKH